MRRDGWVLALPRQYENMFVIKHTSSNVLRARQKFGKFRIVRRIAQGGFANVYRAYDTVEGIHVALKIPHPHMLIDRALDDFLKEVRITARLDHPNILHIKNAGFIENQFVIVYPLGSRTLGDRMRSRVSTQVAIDLAGQMLDALAFAHRKRVIHCDIKPENFILFSNGRLKLSDFGIAKLASRYTLSASGSGTVGYVAPEQAMGKPSLRSDVFSLGLIIYRLLTGHLPKWPFEWPLPGYDRLRRKVSPEFIAFLKKSIDIDERRRYQDASKMLVAFRRVRKQTPEVRRRKRKRRTSSIDWKAERQKNFVRLYGRVLETRHRCGKCGGPMSERMHSCPWCGHKTKTYTGDTRYPARCRVCKRGMKADWRFCVSCFSGVQGPRSERSYSDVRYTTTCRRCRGDLMPYMRYCPWCHTKVSQKWKIGEGKSRCRKCGWGVLPDYWSYCPWCRTQIRK